MKKSCENIIAAPYGSKLKTRKLDELENRIIFKNDNDLKNHNVE